MRTKVFVVNLRNRFDRKKHIIEQFKNKIEFDVNIFPAIRHEVGALGLFYTMKEIVLQEKNSVDDYIILCEDDHAFTKYYNKTELFNIITKAEKLHADILLGGVSYFEDAIQYNENIFWLSGFTGFQFVIIFKRFYEKFLTVELLPFENIDLKMKDLSSKIFCIYPFISIQKEFGYSDVTRKNEEVGVVNEYFIKSEKRLEALSFLKNHFASFY